MNKPASFDVQVGECKMWSRHVQNGESHMQLPDSYVQIGDSGML